MLAPREIVHSGFLLLHNRQVTSNQFCKYVTWTRAAGRFCWQGCLYVAEWMRREKTNDFTGINEWRVAAQSELVVVALPMFLVGQKIIQRDFLAGHNSSRTSQMHVVMSGANNNERLNSFFSEGRLWYFNTCKFEFIFANMWTWKKHRREQLRSI